MTDHTELWRLLDEATPGPWEATTSEATMNDRSGWRIGHPRRPQALFAVMRAADAHLIVSAVNALPALLVAAAERDVLRRRLVAVEMRVEDALRHGYDLDPQEIASALGATPTGGEFKKG